MAKESGIGFTVTVDNASNAAKAITNDVLSLQFGTPRALQDITGLDKTSHERLQLLKDAAGSFSGIFNDAADLSHAVLSTIVSSSQIRTVSLAHSGNTLAVEAYFTDYNLNRAADGGLGWTAPWQNADGAAIAWA